MTNSLGVLTLDLVAKIKDFIQPLSQAERQTSSSTRSILKDFNVTSLAVKTFGAVVAGVTITDLAGFISRTVDAGNEIKKLATLSNASVPQFQYYAAGAKTAGIEIETFADQMKDMQDRIGDFHQTGGGPLADFFNNIAPLAGVTIQQFQKLSGPEALQLFYDSLEKVGSTKNDIKFYMESIIGDSSLLIPLLEKGGTGFKKWGDAAKSSGAILSGEVVNDLAIAKENIQLLDLEWQGLKNTLVSDITPAIVAVTENFDTIQAVAVGLATAIGTRLLFQVGALSVQFAFGVAEGIRYQMTLAAMAGQSVRTAAAVGLLKAVTGVLGGPTGIAMLAVQGLAAYSAFKYMQSSSDDLKQSLFDQQGTIEDLTKQYIALNAEQRQLEASKLREKIEDEAHAVELATNKYVALSMSKDGIWSIQQIDAYNAMVKSITQNGELTNEAFEKIKATGLFSTKDLDEVAKYNSEYGSVNWTLTKHQDLLLKLESKEKDIANAHRETAKAVENSANKYANLTEKQREYVKSVDTQLASQNYIELMISAGMPSEKAIFFADKRKETGMTDWKKGMPENMRMAVSKEWDSKNYTFTSNDLKAIAKVNGIASNHNFAQIEAMYGLPKGSLAALVLQESGGRSGAMSPTGAKGLFQTTGVFRKEYGLTTKSSVEAQASAAAQDLSKNLKVFGSIDKALMAYNAGAGGLNSYMKGGLTASKRIEVAGYVPGWAKWYAGVNGKTTIDQNVLNPSQSSNLEQIATSEAATKDLADKRLDIESKYYTKSQSLAEDNSKAIELINETFGGDPKKLAEALSKQSEFFNNQKVQLNAEKKSEFQTYFNFETDRITQISQSYDKEKSLILVNTEYTKAERKKIGDALERQKQAEIEAVKREDQQQVQSVFEAYMNETEIVLNRYKVERDEIFRTYEFAKDQSQLHTKDLLLQANQMAVSGVLDKNRQKIDDKQYQSLDYLHQKNQPQKAAWTDLQNRYDGENGSLDKDYSEQRTGIFNGVDSELERTAQLLAAHEEYLHAKATLDDEYAERERNLKSAQLQMNLGYGEQIFGSMTDMLKNAGREQSGIYKALFAVQKAFSIASSIVAIQMGIAEASANPFPYNLAAMATVAAATASIITNISSIGFATGGYTGDGGKYEAAGLVHKGEVVWSQDDVARWGGVAKVEAMRLGIDGYSNGGIVGLDAGIVVSDKLLNSSAYKDFSNLKGNSNGIKINIINKIDGAQFSSKTENDGSVTIEVVRKTAEEIAREAFTRLNSANSFESQQLQQNYNLDRNR